MAFVNSTDIIRRFDAAEENLCVAFNRWSKRRPIHMSFAVVSRLGNGVFWYTLILALPFLFGAYGIMRAVQLTITGLIGVAVYKWLKRRFVRERPYISHLRVHAGAAPLDRYSFPSGHTLHAVSFAILLSEYFPMFTWIVVPFAGAVALSRMVLGLHYPTDVLVGGAIGASLALLSMSVVA